MKIELTKEEVFLAMEYYLAKHLNIPFTAVEDPAVTSTRTEGGTAFSCNLLNIGEPSEQPDIITTDADEALKNAQASLLNAQEEHLRKTTDYKYGKGKVNEDVTEPEDENSAPDGCSDEVESSITTEPPSDDFCEDVKQAEVAIAEDSEDGLGEEPDADDDAVKEEEEEAESDAPEEPAEEAPEEDPESVAEEDTLLEDPITGEEQKPEEDSKVLEDEPVKMPNPSTKVSNLFAQVD